MKFIYTQDEHGKMKNPSGRTDNYYEAWLKKIEEACQIFRSEKCDYWISGGDLLDIPIVSYKLIDDFIDLVEKYDVKLRLLWGNHPMIGADMKHSKSTSLAHIIRRSKNIEYLTSIETEDEIINGHEYYFRIENDINEKGLMYPIKEDDLRKHGKLTIGIVHALIMDKPFFKEVAHSVIGKFETNYDYIFIAHYHETWGIKKIGETTYINIGALGRTTLPEHRFKPSCAIYETGKPLIIRPLASAGEGKDIFDLTKYKEKKKFDKDIGEFVEMISNTKFQEMDIMNVIEMIAKEHNIDKDIVDCVIDKIAEVSK